MARDYEAFDLLERLASTMADLAGKLGDESMALRLHSLAREAEIAASIRRSEGTADED